MNVSINQLNNQSKQSVNKAKQSINQSSQSTRQSSQSSKAVSKPINQSTVNQKSNNLTPHSHSSTNGND